MTTIDPETRAVIQQLDLRADAYKPLALDANDVRRLNNHLDSLRTQIETLDDQVERRDNTAAQAARRLLEKAIELRQDET